MLVAVEPAAHSFAEDYNLRTVLRTSHYNPPAVVHNPGYTAHKSAGRTEDRPRSLAAGWGIGRTEADYTLRIADIAVQVEMIELRAEKRRHRAGRYFPLG